MCLAGKYLMYDVAPQWFKLDIPALHALICNEVFTDVTNY
jgi:hypothetical protein